MSDDFVEELIAVPDDIVRTIAGENGILLEDVSMETGAKLVWHPQGADQNVILLSGNSTQVSQAKRLLWSIAEKTQPAEEEHGARCDVEDKATKTKGTDLAYGPTNRDVDSSEPDVSDPPRIQGQPRSLAHRKNHSDVWEEDFSWAWAYNKEEHKEPQEKTFLKSWLDKILHSPLEVSPTNEPADKETNSFTAEFSVDPSTSVASIKGDNTNMNSRMVRDTLNVSREEKVVLMDIGVDSKQIGSESHITTSSSLVDTLQNVASPSHDRQEICKEKRTQVKHDSKHGVLEEDVHFGSSVDDINQIDFDADMIHTDNSKLSIEQRDFGSSVDRIDQIALDISATSQNISFGGVEQTGSSRILNDENDLSSSVDDLYLNTSTCTHGLHGLSSQQHTNSKDISSNSRKFQNRRENSRSSRYHSNPEFFSNISSYLKSNTDTYTDTHEDFSSSVDDLSEIVVPDLAEGSSVDKLQESEEENPVHVKTSSERHTDLKRQRDSIPQSYKQENPMEKLALAGLSLSVNQMLSPIVIGSGTSVDGTPCHTSGGINMVIDNKVEENKQFESIGESRHEVSSEDVDAKHSSKNMPKLSPNVPQIDKDKKKQNDLEIIKKNVNTNVTTKMDATSNPSSLPSLQEQECADITTYSLSTTKGCPWFIDPKTGKIYYDVNQDIATNSKQQHHFIKLLFDPRPKVLNLEDHDIISRFSTSKERPAIFMRKKALLARRSTRYITSCERATKYLRRQSTAFIHISESTRDSIEQTDALLSKFETKERVQNEKKSNAEENHIHEQKQNIDSLAVETDEETLALKSPKDQSHSQEKDDKKKSKGENSLVSTLTIQPPKCSPNKIQETDNNIKVKDKGEEEQIFVEKMKKSVLQQQPATTDAISAERHSETGEGEECVKELDLSENPTIVDSESDVPEEKGEEERIFVEKMEKSVLQQEQSDVIDLSDANVESTQEESDGDLTDLGGEEGTDALEKSVVDTVDDPTVLDRPESREAVDDELITPVNIDGALETVDIEGQTEGQDPDFKDSFDEKDDVDIGVKEQHMEDTENILESEVSGDGVPDALDDPTIIDRPTSPEADDEEQSLPETTDPTQQTEEKDVGDVKDEVGVKQPELSDSPHVVDTETECLGDKTEEEIIVEEIEKSVLLEQAIVLEFNKQDSKEADQDEDEEVAEAFENEEVDTTDDPTILERPDSREAFDDQLIKPILEANKLESDEHKEVAEYNDPDFKDSFNDFYDVDIGIKEHHTGERSDRQDPEESDFNGDEVPDVLNDPDIVTNRPNSPEALDDEMLQPLLLSSKPPDQQQPATVDVISNERLSETGEGEECVKVKELDLSENPTIVDSESDVPEEKGEEERIFVEKMEKSVLQQEQSDVIDLSDANVESTQEESDGDLTDLGGEEGTDALEFSVVDTVDDPTVLDRPESREAVDDELITPVNIDGALETVDIEGQTEGQDPDFKDSFDEKDDVDIGVKEQHMEDTENILESEVSGDGVPYALDDPTIIDRPTSPEADDEEQSLPETTDPTQQTEEKDVGDVKDEVGVKQPELSDSPHVVDTETECLGDKTEEEIIVEEIEKSVLLEQAIVLEFNKQDSKEADQDEDEEVAEAFENEEVDTTDDPTILERPDSREAFDDQLIKPILEANKLESDEHKEVAEYNDPDFKDSFNDFYDVDIGIKEHHTGERSDRQDPEESDFNGDEVPDVLNDPDIVTNRPNSPEALDDEMLQPLLLSSKPPDQQQPATVDVISNERLSETGEGEECVKVKELDLSENPTIVDSESDVPEEKGEEERIFVEKMEKSVLQQEQSDVIDLSDANVESTQEESDGDLTDLGGEEGTDALEFSVVDTVDDPTVLDRPESREAVDDELITPVNIDGALETVDIEGQTEGQDPDFKDSFDEKDDVDIGVKEQHMEDTENILESEVSGDGVPDALDDPTIIDRPTSPEADDEEQSLPETTDPTQQTEEKDVGDVKDEVGVKQPELSDSPHVVDTETECLGDKTEEEIIVEEIEKSVLLEQAIVLEFNKQDSKEADQGEDEEVAEAFENEEVDTTDDPTILERPDSREAFDDQLIKPILEANKLESDEHKEVAEYNDPDFKDSFNDIDDVDIGIKEHHTGERSDRQDPEESDFNGDEVPDVLNDPDIVTNRPNSPEALDDEMLQPLLLSSKPPDQQQPATVDVISNERLSETGEGEECVKVKELDLSENPTIVDSESDVPEEKGEEERIFVEKMEKSVLQQEQSDVIDLSDANVESTQEESDGDLTDLGGEEGTDALEFSVVDTVDDPTVLDRPESREAVDDELITPVNIDGALETVDIEGQTEGQDPDFKDSFDEKDDVDIGVKEQHMEDTENILESEVSGDGVPDALDDPTIIDRPTSPEADDEEQSLPETTDPTQQTEEKDVGDVKDEVGVKQPELSDSPHVVDTETECLGDKTEEEIIVEEIEKSVLLEQAIVLEFNKQDSKEADQGEDEEVAEAFENEEVDTTDDPTILERPDSREAFDDQLIKPILEANKLESDEHKEVAEYNDPDFKDSFNDFYDVDIGIKEHHTGERSDRQDPEESDFNGDEVPDVLNDPDIVTNRPNSPEALDDEILQPLLLSSKPPDQQQPATVDVISNERLSETGEGEECVKVKELDLSENPTIVDSESDVPEEKGEEERIFVEKMEKSVLQQEQSDVIDLSDANVESTQEESDGDLTDLGGEEGTDALEFSVVDTVDDPTVLDRPESREAVDDELITPVNIDGALETVDIEGQTEGQDPDFKDSFDEKDDVDIGVKEQHMEDTENILESEVSGDGVPYALDDPTIIDRPTSPEADDEEQSLPETTDPTQQTEEKDVGDVKDEVGVKQPELSDSPHVVDTETECLGDKTEEEIIVEEIEKSVLLEQAIVLEFNKQDSKEADQGEDEEVAEAFENEEVDTTDDPTILERPDSREAFDDQLIKPILEANKLESDEHKEVAEYNDPDFKDSFNDIDDVDIGIKEHHTGERSDRQDPEESDFNGDEVPDVLNDPDIVTNRPNSPEALDDEILQPLLLSSKPPDQQQPATVDVISNERLSETGEGEECVKVKELDLSENPTIVDSESDVPEEKGEEERIFVEKMEKSVLQQEQSDVIDLSDANVESTQEESDGDLTDLGGEEGTDALEFSVVDTVDDPTVLDRPESREAVDDELITPVNIDGALETVDIEGQTEGQDPDFKDSFDEKDDVDIGVKEQHMEDTENILESEVSGDGVPDALDDPTIIDRPTSPEADDEEQSLPETTDPTQQTEEKDVGDVKDEVGVKQPELSDSPHVVDTETECLGDKTEEEIIVEEIEKSVLLEPAIVLEFNKQDSKGADQDEDEEVAEAFENEEVDTTDDPTILERPDSREAFDDQLIKPILEANKLESDEHKEVAEYNDPDFKDSFNDIDDVDIGIKEHHTGERSDRQDPEESDFNGDEVPDVLNDPDIVTNRPNSPEALDDEMLQPLLLSSKPPDQQQPATVDVISNERLSETGEGEECVKVKELDLSENPTIVDSESDVPEEKGEEERIFVEKMEKSVLQQEQSDVIDLSDANVESTQEESDGDLTDLGGEEGTDALEFSVVDTVDDPTVLDRPESREAVDDELITPVNIDGALETVDIEGQTEGQDPDFKDSFDEKDDVDIGVKEQHMEDTENILESEVSGDGVPDALDDPTIIDRPTSPEADDEEQSLPETTDPTQQTEEKDVGDVKDEVGVKQPELSDSPHVVDTETECLGDKTEEEIIVEEIEKSVLLEQAIVLEFNKQDSKEADQGEDEEVAEAFENEEVDTTDDPTILERPDSREAFDDQLIKPILEANKLESDEHKEVAEYNDPDFKDSFNDIDDVDIGIKEHHTGERSDRQDPEESDFNGDEVPDVLNDPDIVTNRPNSPEALDDEMLQPLLLSSKPPDQQQPATVDVISNERLSETGEGEECVKVKELDLSENPTIVDSESDVPEEKGEEERIFVEKMEKSVLQQEQSDVIDLSDANVESTQEESDGDLTDLGGEEGTDALEFSVVDTVDDPTVLDRPESREAVDDELITPVNIDGALETVDIEGQTEGQDPDFKDSFDEKDDVDIGVKEQHMEDTENILESEVSGDGVPDALDDPTIIDRPTSPEADDEEQSLPETTDPTQQTEEKDVGDVKDEVGVKQPELSDSPHVVDTETECLGDKTEEEIIVEEIEKSVLLEQAIVLEFNKQDSKEADQDEDEEVAEAFENEEVDTTDDPTILERPDSREAFDDQLIKPILEANKLESDEHKEVAEYNDPDFKDSFNDIDDVDIGIKEHHTGERSDRQDPEESDFNGDEVPDVLNDPDIEKDDVDIGVKEQHMEDTENILESEVSGGGVHDALDDLKIIDRPTLPEADDEEQSLPETTDPTQQTEEKDVGDVKDDIGVKQPELSDTPHVVDTETECLKDNTEEEIIVEEIEKSVLLEQAIVLEFNEQDSKEADQDENEEMAEAFENKDLYMINNPTENIYVDRMERFLILPDPSIIIAFTIIDVGIVHEENDNGVDRDEFEDILMDIMDESTVLDRSESRDEVNDELITPVKDQTKKYVLFAELNKKDSKEADRHEDEEVAEAFENKELDTTDDPTILKRHDSREAFNDQFIKPILETNKPDTGECKEIAEYHVNEQLLSENTVLTQKMEEKDYQAIIDGSEINVKQQELNDHPKEDTMNLESRLQHKLDALESFAGDSCDLEQTKIEDKEMYNEDETEVQSMVSALSRRMSCQVESNYMVDVMDEVNTIVDKVNTGLREGTLATPTVISELSRITQLRPQPDIGEETEDEISSTSNEVPSNVSQTGMKQTEQQIFDLLDEIISLLGAVTSSASCTVEESETYDEEENIATDTDRQHNEVETSPVVEHSDGMISSSNKEDKVDQGLEPNGKVPIDVSQQEEGHTTYENNVSFSLRDNDLQEQTNNNVKNDDPHDGNINVELQMIQIPKLETEYQENLYTSGQTLSYIPIEHERTGNEQDKSILFKLQTVYYVDKDEKQLCKAQQSEIDESKNITSSAEKDTSNNHKVDDNNKTCSHHVQDKDTNLEVEVLYTHNVDVKYIEDQHEIIEVSNIEDRHEVKEADDEDTYHINETSVMDTNEIDETYLKIKHETDLVDAENTHETDVVDVDDKPETDAIDVEDKHDKPETVAIDVDDKTETDAIDVEDEHDKTKTVAIDVDDKTETDAIDVEDEHDKTKTVAIDVEDKHDKPETVAIDVDDKHDKPETVAIDVDDKTETDAIDVEDEHDKTETDAIDVEDKHDKPETVAIDVDDKTETDAIDVEDEHDKTETDAIDVEDKHDKPETDVIDVEDKHEIDMVEAADKHETDVFDVEDKHAIDYLVDAEDKHETEVVDIEDKHETEVVDIEDKHETEVVVDDRPETLVVVVEDKHETDMVEVEDKHEIDEIDVEDKHEIDSVDAENKHETDVVDIDDKHKTDVVDVEDKHETNIADVGDTHETDVVHVKYKPGTDVFEAEDKHETDVVDVEDKCETDIVDVEDKREIVVVDVEDKRETDMVDVEDTCETVVVDVEDRSETDVVHVEDKNRETNLVEVENRNETGIVDAEDKDETDVADVDDTHETVVVDVEDINKTDVVDVEDKHETNVVHVEKSPEEMTKDKVEKQEEEEGEEAEEEDIDEEEREEDCVVVDDDDDDDGDDDDDDDDEEEEEEENEEEKVEEQHQQELKHKQQQPVKGKEKPEESTARESQTGAQRETVKDQVLTTSVWKEASVGLKHHVHEDPSLLDMPTAISENITVFDTKSHIVHNEHQIIHKTDKSQKMISQYTERLEDKCTETEKPKKQKRIEVKSSTLKAKPVNLANDKSLSKSQKRRLRKIKGKVVNKQNVNPRDSGSPDKQQEIDQELTAKSDKQQKVTTGILFTSPKPSIEMKQSKSSLDTSSQVFTQSESHSKTSSKKDKECVKKEKVESTNGRSRDSHKRESKNKSTISLQQQHSQTEHQLPSITIGVDTEEIEQVSTPLLCGSTENPVTSATPTIAIACDDELVFHQERISVQSESQQDVGLLTIPHGSRRRSRSKSQDRPRSKSQGRSKSRTRSKSPMAPNLRRIRGEPPRTHSRKHNIVTLDGSSRS